MNDNVSLALKNYFIEKNITLNDIAEKFGVTTVHIGHLLNGKKQFGRGTAKKWHEAYGFSIAWLMTGEGSMFQTDKVSANKVDYKRLERRIQEQDKEIEELKAKYDKVCENFFTLCEKLNVTFPL